MGSASVKDLESAKAYWDQTVNAGETAGKLSFEAADMARQAGNSAEAEADGYFSSDSEEALAFWTALDLASADWLMYSDERGYLATIIQGQLAHRAKADSVAAEASYTEQLGKKATDAAQAAEDVLVETGKDPSGLWGGAGAVVGGLLGGPLGAPLGAIGGAAIGAGLGWAAGKAKAAGLL